MTIREEPCPECYQICDWCSWHRWQARESGCGDFLAEGRRRRCQKAEAIRGTACGTCDGSRKVLVERRIIQRGTKAAQKP